MGTENVADASHGQWRRSCIFCAAVVNGKGFLIVQNRTAVTKEERLRQRKNCVAIDKELPHCFSCTFQLFLAVFSRF